MLDSNLPTYYFKPPNERERTYDESVLYTQYDSEPEPRYLLKHPDRSQEVAKNVYAAAVVDAYISEIVYGEVLIKPEWTQPSLSAEEIRKNGGVPPPPVPIIPPSFVIQLYNPEQQIIVTEKPASFASSPSYSFSIPQNSFRQPSASALDRSQDGPVADLTTPKIHLKWKQEGKLSKELSCSITGRSTDNSSKKKGGKEPNIMVALFTNNYRDLQIYESNLQRIEMEDYKGLEIVLLLGAAVIRDVYCGQQKDCFNTGEAPRKNSAAALRPGGPMLSNYNRSTASLAQPIGTGPQLPPRPHAHSQPADARKQWELDNETARLQRAHEMERRLAEQRRLAQEKKDQEEARRLQKLMDEEDRRRRKSEDQRRAEIDRETERLRREFGDQTGLFPPSGPAHQNNRHSAPALHVPGAYPQSPVAAGPRPPHAQQGPYLQAPHQGHGRPAASQSSFFGGSGGGAGASQQQQAMKPKRSFFGLRSASQEPQQQQQRDRLNHKKSSVW